MEAIYIPQLLKSPEKTETIQFQEFLPDLETLTPVRGWIKIKHGGNFLEVSANAETIITLTCHRCLQQYNHRLAANTSEIIWLDEAAEQTDILVTERELSLEDLVETLPPRGYFDPRQWIYEQLCLQIPQRQLCDNDCAGIPTAVDDSTQSVDKRWASLQSLKKHLHG